MGKLSIDINVKKEVILQFLEDPFNLQLWTVHRDLYNIDGKCYECIFGEGHANFAEIKSSFKTLNSLVFDVHFTWSQDGVVTKSFGFQLNMITDSQANLCLNLPDSIPEEKRNKMIRVISIELGLLKQLMETSVINISKSDAAIMQSYHENISFS